MGDSIFRKIAKILEKPEMPAHMRERQHRVVIPWYENLLNALRPPSASGARHKPISVSQRRVLAIVGIVIAVFAAGWWVFDRVSTAPERARVAYEAGLRLLGPSDFKGAIEKFSDSISIRATPAAYVERGNAYRNLNQHEKALEDWSRAIDLDSSSELAYSARGTHYRITGKNAEALVDLDRSLQIKPNVEAFYQRGQVYASQGRFEEALKDYDQAIELHREVPYLYFARAAARRAVGDMEGASEDQAIAMRLQSGQ